MNGREVTTETLAPFVGGQLEVQNGAEGYVFRGKVESAVVRGHDLLVRFAWTVWGEGYPPRPKRWVLRDGVDYELRIAADTDSVVPSLIPSLATAVEVGFGSGEPECLCIVSVVTGEWVVFFRPGISEIAPGMVDGVASGQTH